MLLQGPTRWLLAAACSVSFAVPALAQQPEFTLDNTGVWNPSKTPEPGSDEALIADAARLIAQENPAAALKILNPWIAANKRGDSPLLPRAYLLRGDARTTSGEEFQALYDYERVVKEFPGSEEFVTALEREFEIAKRYVHGLKKRWLGLRIADAGDIGEELFIRIQERLPASRLAELAGLELADYYYRNNNLELAAEAYEIFLTLYPTSEFRMEAMQRRIASNVSRYQGAPYDGGGLLEARILSARFKRDYPAEAERSGIDDGLIARLDNAQARQLLVTAKWYLRRGDPVSARYELQRILRDYPSTETAMTALNMLKERGWEPAAPRPPLTAPDAATDDPALAPAPPEGATEPPPDEAPPAAPGGGR